jgi:prevent-host-death family protein
MVISANEAKQKFGAMMGWAVEHGDEVIVESHGKPKVVIMAYAEYETVRQLREQARRREALERLHRAKERVSARNRDLTEEQALALADRFVREVIDDMAAEGTLTFERDQC